MAKKLTREQLLEIERRLLEGESGLSLAKEFKVSEGTIRYNFPKKQAELDNAVDAVIHARTAVAKLPKSLQLRVANLADVKMQIIDMQSRSALLAAQTAYKMTQIANTQADKIDEHAPDLDTARVVHGFLETAKVASYQPIELMKVAKDAQPDVVEAEEVPKLDPSKLSNAALAEIMAAMGK